MASGQLARRFGTRQKDFRICISPGIQPASIRPTNSALAAMDRLPRDSFRRLLFCCAVSFARGCVNGHCCWIPAAPSWACAAAVDHSGIPRQQPVDTTPACGRGGMVDATDLKSVVRKGVRVRVPPPAPRLLYGSRPMRPGAGGPLSPLAGSLVRQTILGQATSGTRRKTGTIYS